LIELSRFSPSGGNFQPLKFILSNIPEKNKMIFPCLGWAGYLKNWTGPEEGERPSAYIIILGDSSIKAEVKNDQGIAAQSMLLGAVDMGFGGCIIGSVKRDNLRSALKIDLKYEILLVLALGRPKETVVIEDLNTDGDIRYWRDENEIHHVPKRSLDDLILES
jgi:nitroreductase